MNRVQIRALIILGVFLLIGGVVFYWLYNSSFISVSITNATNSQLTYTFTSQQSNKQTRVESSQNSIKKRLPRGDYSVEVTQGGTSFVAITTSPGLMRTESVDGTVQAERSRTFIGNNPSPCMFYNGTLYSFTCGAGLSSVNRHVPGTATSPTYVQQPFKNNYQDADSMVTTGGGNMYTLIKTHAGSGASDEYVFATLDASGKVTEVSQLPDLDAGVKYRLTPYKEGFVVFSQNFETILYYTSPQAKPEKITIDKPKDTVLRGSSLFSLGDTLVLMYSSISAEDISDAGSGDATKDVKDEIVVFRNGTTTRFTPDTHATSGALCGTNKLCTIEGANLVVYDISNNKLKQLYHIPNVQGVRNIGSNLFVIQNDQVLLLNADDAKGYIAYNMGSYKYCGLGQSEDNLLLCVSNEKNQKVALLINPNEPMAEPIDKQVASLLKQADIKDVSAYKNFIYIVPNYGRTVFVPSLGSFGYDPAVVNVVNQKINNTIKALQINTNAYTIGGLSPQ